MNCELKVIARVRNGFSEKFSVPRQPGLVDSVLSRVVFEREYASPEAIRGVEGYSHLWLIWGFSETPEGKWSPTVRPPRLGGNKRIGVFATRSPFRPNPIGLSCVRLVAVERGELIVAGADMVDGTPVFDIKPYLAYTDSHPDAVGGFTDTAPELRLAVDFPEELLASVPEGDREAVMELLSRDPRPAYKRDGDRVYGLTYNGVNYRFTVADGTLAVVGVSVLP